jgi:tetratricopeptide (TPR) repeat protein
MIQTETDSLLREQPMTLNSIDIRRELNLTTSQGSNLPNGLSQSSSLVKKRSVSPQNFHLNLLPTAHKSEVNNLVAESKRLKLDADDKFNRMEYPAAIDLYCLALSFLTQLKANMPSDKFDDSLAIKIMANISQCLLKLNRFEESLAYNLQIIKLDKQYIKAYYRAGVALKSLHKEEEALEILRQGLPYAKENSDEQSKQLYLSLYNETVKTYNKNLSEIREKMKDFFNENKRAQLNANRPAFILNRTTVMWSLCSAALATGLCLAKTRRVGPAAIGLLAGNAIGSALALGSASYKQKAFCFGGLIIFNYLLFKILK